MVKYAPHHHLVAVVVVVIRNELAVIPEGVEERLGNEAVFHVVVAAEEMLVGGEADAEQVGVYYGHLRLLGAERALERFAVFRGDAVAVPRDAVRVLLADLEAVAGAEHDPCGLGLGIAYCFIASAAGQQQGAEQKGGKNRLLHRSFPFVAHKSV